MAQGRPLTLNPGVSSDDLKPSKNQATVGTVYLFIRACMGYYDRIQELTYLNFGSIMGNKLTKLT